MQTANLQAALTHIPYLRVNTLPLNEPFLPSFFLFFSSQVLGLKALATMVQPKCTISLLQMVHFCFSD